MIGYVTLGTNKFDQAAKFYDELMATISAGRFMESDSFIAWAISPETPGLSIIKPFDGRRQVLVMERWLQLVLIVLSKSMLFIKKPWN